MGKFLSLTYGAIHWLLRDEGRKSDRPRGPMPIKNLELCESYNDRVFLKSGRIYKFYETDGTRKPNVDLLQLLDYMQQVEDRKLSNKFELISYPFLVGNHVPQTYKQLISIGKRLKDLHSKGMVHGDIRGTNLIFGPPHELKSYMMDPDYASQPGDLYPSTYNGDLDERHPDYGRSDFITPRLFYAFPAEVSTNSPRHAVQLEVIRGCTSCFSHHKLLSTLNTRW